MAHNNVDENRLEVAINSNGFEPFLRRRESKAEKGKGVDIWLAAKALRHAYQDDYDTAVIITSDGDFVPLFAELRDMGKRVVLFTLDSGLHASLAPASTEYVPLERQFEKCLTQIFRTGIQPPQQIPSSTKKKLNKRKKT